MNTTTQGNIAADQLKSYLERIEKLQEEKAEIASFIKDVFAEAKGNGYDVKAIKEVLKLRKLKPHEREEQEYMVDVYKKAIGLTFDSGSE
jgi:uncharacterized protein (UPF0335 family)